MWKGLPYFNENEFTCKCGCNGTVTEEFIVRLVKVRETAGFPFVITSGFRCPEYNALVSATGGDGPHTKGRASDIKVYGERSYTLIKLAIENGFTGIGIQQKGNIASRYVHLDDLTFSDGFPRPNVWTY